MHDWLWWWLLASVIAGLAWALYRRANRLPINPVTGRPLGDHGYAMDALNFVLDVHEPDPGNQIEFLKAWRLGDVADEWPEFYEWLKA